MDFSSFFSDFVVTVAAGAVFTYLLFLAKERAFRVPQLDGVWEVTTTTTTSIRDEYIGLVLIYRVIISQAGTQIGGSAEKIREEPAGGQPHDFPGPKRVRSILEGSIQKNYLTHSVMSFHMTEEGRVRTSSSFFRCQCKRDGTMEGSFHSTAADSSGSTRWKRLPT